jgi:Ser/Thr protein kinase RdoA (MazF antagonist)
VSGLAHGVSGGMVAADWPALTVAELVPVLAHYPALGAVERVLWHSVRPFAASALVACAAGPVFVKRHHPAVRGVADLLEEHAFIAHLRARGAAVAAVLRAVDGRSALAGAPGTYEAHAPGDGADLYRDAPSWTTVRGVADARAAGAALGRLHVAAAGFDAPARRTRLLVAADFVSRAADPMAALLGWVEADARLRAALAGRPWQRDAARVLMPLYPALAPRRDAMSPLWTHGDFHASNLLWRDGEVSCVLDFGMCGLTSAVFDLATCIERNAIAWLRLADGRGDIGRVDLARAIVAGYAGAAPFSPAQRAALARLLPVVHVEFALSELAYFHGVTGSAHDAEAAYTDFLLGHARWFQSPDGLAFLARLVDSAGCGVDAGHTKGSPG